MDSPDPSHGADSGSAHTLPSTPGASHEAGAKPASIAPSAGEDDLLGQVIHERYKLIAKLGTGGMGAVYKGEHVRLRKAVAVKFLHKHMSSNKELVTRFEREAIAAANLEHPNVVGATDFGRLPDGTFFLVMEFVDGRSLRKLLQEELSVEPARALRILRQIAAALTRAHSMGIVHRDLKPENVVLTDRDGEYDVVKVIDFGIARVSGSAFGAGGTALTQMGTVFGTPEYMAPEQAMGQPVDGRADQYALGVIAFEMLTGRRPFDADDAIDLLRMHVGAPIPSIRTHAPQLSEAVDAVIARILAKRPGQRFDSATIAIDALIAAFEGRTSAIPATPPDSRTSLPQADGPRGSQPSPVVSQAPAQPRVAAVAHAGPARPAALTGPEISLGTQVPTTLRGVRGPAIAPVAYAGVAALLALSVVLGLATRPQITAPSLTPATGEAASGGAANTGFESRFHAYNTDPEAAPAIAASNRGRPDALVTLMRARRARNPRDGFAAYHLGMAYANQGEARESLEAFADALRLEPLLAEDATMVPVIVRALDESATQSQAQAMLSRAPLASSRRAAQDLAGQVVLSDSAEAPALALAFRARTLLSPLDRARVELRAARDCAEVRAAVQSLEAIGAQGPLAEAHAVQDGQCTGMRVRDCARCFERGNRRKDGAGP